MVNIVFISLPDSNVSYKKTSYQMTPEFIVIHNTANKGTARGEINYMHQSDAYTSYHFAVDDIEIVQGLRLDQNGWHAGDGEAGLGNRKGIGIEICYSYDPTDPEDNTWHTKYRAKFEKAQQNAAELTAHLLHEYGWGLDLSRVTKHQDYGNKYCPHRTLSEYGWDYFLQLVANAYNQMYPSKEENNMTQEEFNIFMNKYLAGLADEQPSDWSKKARDYCVKKGYFKGDTNGDFRWKSQITREEVAQLLYNIEH